MSKATAVAHSNLAFVKYWGKSNTELNLPLNGSISMNLSEAKTTTTVEFDPLLEHDDISILDEEESVKAATRITKHLNRIRKIAGIDTSARVRTRNSFPQGTGMASSASGFAALTLAACNAAGLQLSQKELSILARRGSGSASRSIPNGFVEWHASKDATDSSSSYAEEIFPADHWDIADVCVAISTEEKEVGSSEGHELAGRSPFFKSRMDRIETRLSLVRNAIRNRDFVAFGQEVEAEAIEFHSIAMTSVFTNDEGWHSGIYYWKPETLELMLAVQAWRRDLDVYFTLDAGPTVHLICRQPQIGALKEKLSKLQRDRDWTISINVPAPGAYLIQDSL